MAKNSIRDFSATAGSNTDIQSVNIDENCPASGINTAIRELMVDLKNVSTGAVNLETPAADTLGVATSSQSTTLQVGDGSADTRSLFNPSSAFAIGVKNGSSHGGFIGSNGSSGMQFSSSGGAARMTIDSSGNLLVGTTNATPGVGNTTAGISLNSGDLLCVSRSGDTPVSINRSTSDGSLVDFRASGTKKGSITIASAGTTYNTTSDRRLKTDIEPIADATDKLMQMQPVTHKWIAEPDADAVHGFIAQDMQQIVPEAVSGEDGGEEMMSMDYGRITPVLVAALQDAHRKIEELEQRLSEMEN